MMRKTAFSVMSAAAVVLAAACSQDVTSVPADRSVLLAPATAGTEVNDKDPFSFVVFVPCANGCAGETVPLDGFLHTLINVRSNANGGFGLKLHFQPQGVTGVGSVTGDKYQATGVTQQNANVNAAVTVTFVNNFRVIGQGPGNNFLVHENAHVTVNANGETTVDHDNFSIECK